MEYKIIKTENGYIIEQYHTCGKDPEGLPFQTKWVFNQFDEAIDFLAHKFEGFTPDEVKNEIRQILA